MKINAYNGLTLKTYASSRRGWSLILLLFIMAAFVSSFPLIFTHLQTNSQVVSAFESWSKLQRAQDLIPQAAKHGSITITYPLPGYQSLNIVISPVKVAENPDELWEMRINSFVASSDMQSPSGFTSLKLAVKIPGDGSPDFPFAIATAKDLELLRQHPEENKNFVIAGNIELPTDPDFVWTPIGTRTNPFKGIVRAFQDEDGNYFTISGMTIKPTAPADTKDTNFGFFGVVNGGVLENVFLKNVDVDSRAIANANTGSLVGLIEGKTVIRNCFASGQVVGKSNVGGLIGSSLDSTIEYCKVSTNVGVSMPNSPSTPYVPVINPSAGQVFAPSGGGTSGSIRASVVIGRPMLRASIIPASNTPVGENVGGLVGYTNGTVSNSTASGNVSGIKQVGGLIGFADTGAQITSSRAFGSVTASNLNSGGLIGLASGSVVIGCGAFGTVASSLYFGGGLVGQADSTSISNSYATGNVTGPCTFMGGLVGGLLNGSSITSSYARGIVDSGTTNYTTGGLVGEVRNSNITNSNAQGAVNGRFNVGGLIGVLSSGLISNSYAEGNVTISRFAGGGLVGFTEGGSISSCYAIGNVTGVGASPDHLGGLIGVNSSVLSSCFSSGQVTGINVVGGLIGANAAGSSATYCYSIGLVTGTLSVGGLIGSNLGTVSFSYWNTQTSGQSFSAGGEGRTTYQLQFGISNQTVSGQLGYQTWVNTDWHFNPTTEYPRLKKAYTCVLSEVPGGTYQRDASPANLSTVTGFRMSLQEVTQQQYMAAMGLSNPSYVIGTQFPVQGINWYAAIAFCNRLSIIEGLTPTYTVSGSINPDIWGAIPTVRTTAWDNVTCAWAANGYRLSTEDENQWASMGAQNNYLKAFSGSTGTNIINDYAWYLSNSGSSVQKSAVLLPNEIGLFDMSGNMWDIVWDRSGVRPTGSRTNYRGPNTGTDRIVRGGDFTRDASWQTVASNLRILPPAGIYSNVGFRVIRKL